MRQWHGPHPRPGEEPGRQRVAATIGGAMSVLGFVVYVGVILTAITLLVEHTVRSIALGIVLLVAGTQMVALRVYLVMHRRRAGRNVITGLAPRVRKSSD
jgi:uncharacterized membrane protein